MKVILAALAIVAVGSAAWSPSHEPGPRTDPATGLGVRAAVPSHVMSTLRRSCFDCHSNETRWPWYSSLPIASWLISRDVESGRGQINFSRWTEYNPFDRASTLVRMCEMVTSGAMPLARYRVLHPEARLSDADVTELCDWTRAEATRLSGGDAPQAPAGAEGWQIPEGAAAERNPVLSSAEVLAKGKSLYRAKCERCHGADGTGHGPEADPGHPPADLTDGRRAFLNPDGVMFYKIWNGRAKPKMPAMKSDIAQADVWMIVNYVKTLRK